MQVACDPAGLITLRSEGSVVWHQQNLVLNILKADIIGHLLGIHPLSLHDFFCCVWRRCWGMLLLATNSGLPVLLLPFQRRGGLEFSAFHVICTFILISLLIQNGQTVRLWRINRNLKKIQQVEWNDARASSTFPAKSLFFWFGKVSSAVGCTSPLCPANVVPGQKFHLYCWFTLGGRVCHVEHKKYARQRKIQPRLSNKPEKWGVNKGKHFYFV